MASTALAVRGSNAAKMSKEELVKKVESSDRRAARMRKEKRETRVAVAALAAGTAAAIGSGVLFEKFPEFKTLPGLDTVPTGLALGTGAIVASIWMGDYNSIAIEAGKGLAYPALAQFGADTIAPKFGG